MVAKAAPEVIQKVIDAAKADVNALALFIRLLPRPPQFVPIPFHLPPPTSREDQIALIVSKTAAGELDLDSMRALLEGLRTFIVGLAGSEFESRLQRYEQLVHRRDEMQMVMGVVRRTRPRQSRAPMFEFPYGDRREAGKIRQSVRI
jgi:hypothetical protein